MNNIIKNESDHYQINYFAGSLAEKEIVKIIARQEKEYQKILEFLGVQNNRKIKYFLYPSNKIKGEMTGDDGNGHADREKFEVHAVYSEEVKCIGPHEDTHLLAISLGLPPQLFREGLAEYMSGNWDGYSHDFWAKKYLTEKTLPKLTNIINDSDWDQVDDLISYPIAGSFTKYLIETLGKEKFFELYKSISGNISRAENLSAISEITGKSLGQLEDGWKEKIK